MELAELARQKEIEGGQERNRLHRETRNGSWLSAVPHRLNVTELSQEKLRDNLCLRYRLMPQDIPATCDSCGKRFLIKHTLQGERTGAGARQDDGTADGGTDTVG